jgi:hypothetical protein
MQTTQFSFVVLVLAMLLSVGQTTKYRFERPSRVVEIKHGRIQGTLVELPIVPTSTGPPTGSGDGDISFEDDAHEPQASVFHKHHLYLIVKNLPLKQKLSRMAC